MSFNSIVYYTAHHTCADLCVIQNKLQSAKPLLHLVINMGNMSCLPLCNQDNKYMQVGHAYVYVSYIHAFEHIGR